MPEQGQKQPYKYVRDLCMGAGFLVGYLIYRQIGLSNQLSDGVPLVALIPAGGGLVGFGVGFFLKRWLIAHA